MESIRCNGATTGRIRAQINGGVGPYDFNWNNGMFSDSIVTNLGAGAYNLLVTDQNNCTSSAIFQILEPPTFTIDSLRILGGECSTSGNASVAVVGETGGVPPYNYNWSNSPLMVDSVFNLATGPFFVTITDANNCEIILNGIINASSAIDLQINLINPLTCSGDNDARIEAIINGGSAPYNVSWEDGSNNLIRSNLSQGKYLVNILDVNGCSAADSIDIKPLEVITIAEDIIPVSCQGFMNGGVDIKVSGGAAPYSYDWVRLGMTVSTDEDLINALPTSYALVVTDANGCTILEHFTIPVAPSFTIEETINPPQCRWNDNGSISVKISGGNPPYDINWFDTLFLTNGIEIIDIAAGNYKIIVIDSLGCIDSAKYNMPNPIEVDYTLLPTEIACHGDRSGAVVVDVFSGKPPYKYINYGVNEQNSRVFQNLSSGSYEFFVIDARGCYSPRRTITLNTPDSFFIELPRFIDVQKGDLIDLFPNVNGGVPDYSWLWESNVPISDFCDTCTSQSFVATENIFITANVEDENGCETIANVLIRVSEDRIILVPTGFTPNGDMVNDELIVHGTENVEILSFKIFDRWGGLVFENENFTTNELKGWDGKILGEDGQSGIYIWQLTARMNGLETNYSGETNLIR